MKYLMLFLTFFKIGAFTFGGGYAMLPLIQAEVLRNNWMGKEDLVNFIAVSESTPGPFAVNISTYVGTVVGGVFGSFCATLGVVLPSFVIILLLARIYQKFCSNKIVKGAMSGLHPAVVGLIGAAVLSIIPSVFKISSFATFFSLGTVVSLFIMAISIFLICKKCNPIWIIAISAVIGIASGYILHV